MRVAGIILNQLASRYKIKEAPRKDRSGLSAQSFLGANGVDCRAWEATRYATESFVVSLPNLLGTAVTRRQIPSKLLNLHLQSSRLK